MREADVRGPHQQEALREAGHVPEAVHVLSELRAAGRLHPLDQLLHPPERGGGAGGRAGDSSGLLCLKLIK